MTKTIVVSNSKGGAGKSVVSALAAMVSARTKKTLLIDSGWQRHSTGVFLTTEQINLTLLDGLRNKKKLPDCVYHVDDNLDVVPASINLNNFALEFSKVSDYNRELIFRATLPALTDKYDVCIFDTESSLSVLTRNALIMADILIIPILDEGSVTEAQKLLEHIPAIQEAYPDYMKLPEIYALPVAKRIFSADCKKIFKAAKKSLPVIFLPEIKYHSDIAVWDGEKVRNPKGKIQKDFEKSLRMVLQ